MVGREMWVWRYISVYVFFDKWVRGSEYIVMDVNYNIVINILSFFFVIIDL